MNKYTLYVLSKEKMEQKVLNSLRQKLSLALKETIYEVVNTAVRSTITVVEGQDKTALLKALEKEYRNALFKRKEKTASSLIDLISNVIKGEEGKCVNLFKSRKFLDKEIDDLKNLINKESKGRLETFDRVEDLEYYIQCSLYPVTENIPVEVENWRFNHKEYEGSLPPQSVWDKIKRIKISRFF